MSRFGSWTIRTNAIVVTTTTAASDGTSTSDALALSFSSLSFFLLSLFGSFGPTYCKTDEPNYTTASLTGGPPGQGPSQHEFFQMYVGGSIFYGIKIEERFSLLVGAKTRYFVLSDDFGNFGMDGTNIKFNYASEKISPMVGFQVRFGK